jgi:hypothetical protein
MGSDTTDAILNFDLLLPLLELEFKSSPDFYPMLECEEGTSWSKVWHYKSPS